MVATVDPIVVAGVSFVAGLLALLAGGNLVVGSASKIGLRFGLTPVVIGMTVVATGTSAPELAVVAQAVLSGDTELAVGSIVGSNIANILLVLGLAATFGAITVTSRVTRTDIPVMIAASIALLVFSLDGRVTRLDGLFLVAGLISFVAWTLRSVSKDPVSQDVAAAQVAARDDPSGTASTTVDDKSSGRRNSLVRSGLLFVIGVAILGVGARFVVSGAEEIATSLGIPKLIVGLTIVALGTSAPEIVTTVIAVIRGHRELAVGNAVGSNIFNILLVLGTAGLYAPGGVNIGETSIQLDIPIMIGAAIACLPIVFWDHKLDRWEGGLFVAYYGAYLVFLVLDATGNRAADPFALVMLAFVLPLTAITVGIGIVRYLRHRNFTKAGAPATTIGGRS